MRNDSWDDEIIVLLSLLRKIILSSEYYEPAYDTLIGNLGFACVIKGLSRES